MQSAGSAGGGSNPAVPKNPRLLIGVSLVVRTAATPDFAAFARRHFSVVDQLLQNIRRQITAIVLDLPGLDFGGGWETQLDPIVLEFQTNTHFLHVVDENRERLRALFAAPRLQDPGWITMCSAIQRRETVSAVKETIAMDIAALLRKLNRSARSRKFFAKMLTAVLTFHIGWVGSVFPRQLTWPDEREVLGACLQRRELYGTMAQSREMNRTVVVGTDRDLVQHVLRTVSYFLRFSSRYLAEDACLSRPPSQFDRDVHSVGAVSQKVRVEAATEQPPSGTRDSGSEICESIPIDDVLNDLICGISPTLVPFLVLQGLTKMPTIKAVADDLSQHFDDSVVHLPIRCARCVFVDVDNMSIDIVDVQRVSQEGRNMLSYNVEVLKDPALGVHTALSSFLDCVDLRLPLQVCLDALESSLQELCMLGCFLACKSHDEDTILPPGVDKTDVKLLHAIAQYVEQSEEIRI